MDAARTFSRVGTAALQGALVVTIVAGFLSGCGTAGRTAATADAGAAAATEQKTALEAASEPAARTVVFPAAYFEVHGLQSESDQRRALTQLGCTDLVFDDEGNCTATVGDEEYADLVASLYDQTKALVDGLVGSDDYPGVVAVDYDEQFATVTVTFDATAVTAAEALVAQVPGSACTAYQQVAGLPASCCVILVGSDGSELATTVFPETASAL
jgi:hypothetical protein